MPRYRLQTERGLLNFAKNVWRSLGRFIWNSPTATLKFCARNPRLERQISIHDPLHVAINPVMPFPDFFAEDVHAHAGGDLHAEFDFVHAAEAYEAFPADVGAGVEGGELGAAFDH